MRQQPGPVIQLPAQRMSSRLLCSLINNLCWCGCWAGLPSYNNPAQLELPGVLLDTRYMDREEEEEKEKEMEMEKGEMEKEKEKEEDGKEEAAVEERAVAVHQLW
ncbi:hypothetical protein HGM15179_017408 [Zosterops borbonicus]|uniref:Uncharacterized protein n=1 Tax=Zosterops borbonicus TaxID=364589 RepID=A0A8K1G148_9PASS|nr:hypothetical protein HGM15179_017408 [Zosterops borbonicus]